MRSLDCGARLDTSALRDEQFDMESVRHVVVFSRLLKELKNSDMSKVFENRSLSLKEKR